MFGLEKKRVVVGKQLQEDQIVFRQRVVDPGFDSGFAASSSSRFVQFTLRGFPLPLDILTM